VTFRICVDTVPWRANAATTRDAIASAVGGIGGLVPVIKGNGYGLRNDALASEASLLGSEVIAVGTVFEVADVASTFSGAIVVLEPHDPRDPVAHATWGELDNADYGPRLIRTIASEEGWHSAIETADRLGRPIRVLIEGLTSMHRFGLDESDVARLLSDARVPDAIVLEGLALHLPLTQPPAPRRPASAMLHDTTTGMVEHGTARAREVIAWALLWTALISDRLGAAAPDGAATLWVSHLDDSELTSVRSAVAGIPLRARVGTRLWHGARSTLSASGTVLAVHITDREVGYRQRRAPSGGGIIVVSGGTSHGVALSAPSSVTSMRARFATAGNGALEATGRSRSPFRLRGEQLWFAEPPHVSVSLLRIPRGVVPPAVGDEVPCVVRYTTTRADAIVWN